MSKTPIKDLHQFKPIEIITTIKDHQGITRTVYSHVTKLHGLLSDWLKMKEKGVRVLKGVTSLKIHECLDDYYPSQMKPLMQSLLEILDNLRNLLDGIRMLNAQLEAIAQMQPYDDPIILTWSVSQISKSVNEILKSVEKEFNLKKTVVEHVAHCREEQLIEVYVSAWEYEVYFHIDSFAYLFAEVGLAGVP